MKYLNREQLVNALVKASTLDETVYLIVKTLAETGLRVSELNKLAPQNINFQEHFFSIKGKGGKIRNVDIDPNLSQLLALYIKQKEIKNKESIFPFHRATIFRITQKTAGISPHSFRHTYAIHLLRKTRNIRYVQRQLGHSNLSATEIYLQFIEFDQEKAQLSNLYL